MSTETDAYGMSAEERAAFEAWFGSEYDEVPEVRPSGHYDSSAIGFRAQAWAACAKLYREREAAADTALRLQVKINWDLAQRIAELGAEVERLRADAARLDYISEERLILFGDVVEVISPRGVGEGEDLRSAIDAAKADEDQRGHAGGPT